MNILVWITISTYRNILLFTFHLVYKKGKIEGICHIISII